MSEDAPPPPPSALFTFPHRPRVLEPEDSEVLSLLLEELDVRFPSAADIVRQLIPQALLQRCVEVASTYGLQQHSPRPLPREQHSHTQLRRLLSRLLQQQQQQHKHLRQHRFVLLQRRENDGSSGNPVLDSLFHRELSGVRPVPRMIASLLKTRYRWQRTLFGHRGPVYSCVFDHTGSYIFTGSEDSMVKMWRARDALLVRSFKAHIGAISDISVSYDNELVASSGIDGSVCVWHIEQGHLVSIFAISSQPCNRVLFTPDSLCLIAASMDGSCSIWLRHSLAAKPIVILPPRPNTAAAEHEALCVQCSQQHSLIAVGYSSSRVRVFKLHHLYSRRLRCEMELQSEAEVNVVCFSANCLLAVGSSSGLVQLFEPVETGSLQYRPLLRVYTTDRANVSTICFVEQDTAILAGSKAGTLDLFSCFEGAGSHRIVYSHTGGVASVTVHPLYSSFVLSVGYDGRIALCLLTSRGATCRTWEPSDAYRLLDCAFSPSGLEFVATSNYGRVIFFGVGSRLPSCIWPPEQFLTNELFRLDQRSEPQLHSQIERRLLCDHEGNVYLCQPHLFSADFAVEERVAAAASPNINRRSSISRSTTNTLCPDGVRFFLSSDMFVDPNLELCDITDPDERTFEILSSPVPVEADIVLSPLSPLPLLAQPLDLARQRGRRRRTDSLSSLVNESHTDDESNYSSSDAERDLQSLERGEDLVDGCELSVHSEDEEECVSHEVLTRQEERLLMRRQEQDQERPRRKRRKRVILSSSESDDDRKGHRGAVAVEQEDDNAGGDDGDGEEKQEHEEAATYDENQRETQKMLLLATQHERQADSQWLQAVRSVEHERIERRNGFGYVPQLLDRLFFFPAGYEEFLRWHGFIHHQELDEQTETIGALATERGAVQCTVQEVEYVLPQPRSRRRLPVYTRLTLRDEVHEQSFRVHFHPSPVPDFLVLEASLRASERQWQAGDIGRLYLDDVDVFLECTIAGLTGVNQRWNSLHVQWSERQQTEAAASHRLRRIQQQDGRINPWQLHPMSSPSSSKREASVSTPYTTVGLTATMSLSLVRLLEEACMLDAAELFIESVSPIHYPSYRAVVACPMHLSLVLARLTHQHYRSVQALQQDVQLIEHNARTFNGPHSYVVRMATVVVSFLLAGIMRAVGSSSSSSSC